MKRNTFVDSYEYTPIPRIHTRYIYVSVTTERYDANSYANYRAYYIDNVSIEPDLVLVAVLVFNTCSSR